MKDRTSTPTGERPTGFLKLDDYPAAAAFAADLCQHAAALTKEALNLIVGRAFTTWPEDIHTGGWEVCGVKWQGKPMPNAASLAAEIVARHGDAVFNAGYSLMKPGTEITPHVGYTGDVIRLHVGLYVPPPDDGDCALVVGGEARPWRHGEAFLFDDTIQHSAHNRTRHGRIIFLADVVRLNSQ